MDDFKSNLTGKHTARVFRYSYQGRNLHLVWRLISGKRMGQFIKDVVTCDTPKWTYLQDALGYPLEANCCSEQYHTCQASIEGLLCILTLVTETIDNELVIVVEGYEPAPWGYEKYDNQD